MADSILTRSDPAWVEGIALLDGAGLHAGAEPAHALLRGATGKGLGHDDALGAALDVVVAHGGPLRVLAGHLLGLPPERWIGLDFGCGQVTRIDVESWGTVLKWFNR